MKKILLWLCAFAALTAHAQQPADDIDVDQLRKLNMAQVAILSLYVDSVDQAKLTENAITGMLDKLDPHSSYTNAKETKRLTEPLEGNFEGIGVQFNMVDDTLIVLKVIPKGPCEKAGLHEGDRIIQVNGINIAGVKMERDSIMHHLRGPKGSLADLRVVRRGVSEPLRFKVTRDKIPVYTLDASYMIAPGIGYMHLESFGQTSGDECKEHLAKLQEQGMTDLILDLTDNGGGYLMAAQDVASLFLPFYSDIVSTKGRRQDVSHMRVRHAGPMASQGRIVVLVNEYSASAAEIVAGALQDNDRAAIIGRRSFGKGLVQRPIDLPDGSMMRLTVAHYYTPSGRCIQKPYEKGKKDEYDKDLLTRFNHGELCSIDSVHLDSTQVYHTLQLGRTVYGGGGIMPDIFVPLDTTRVTPYLAAIRRHNIINDLCLRYTDANRKQLHRRYANFEAFEADYTVPDELVANVIKQAADKKVTPKDDAERAATEPMLRFLLKSLIIYNLWDRSEYLQFINRENDIVKRALHYLQTNENVLTPPTH